MLDTTIQAPEERVKQVKEFLKNTPSQKITPYLLDSLSTYILAAMDKEEKKQRKILTDNRLYTINKRETSFEGILDKFENGEDGLYNMIINDKNVILTPKVSITQHDLETVPGLADLRQNILKVEAAAAAATGKERAILKEQAKNMRQTQYTLKNSHRPKIYTRNLVKSITQIALDEKVYVDECGNICAEGFSFLRPEIVLVFMQNYSRLKAETWEHFGADARYMLIELEELLDKSLKDAYPHFHLIVRGKIDGLSNAEIQQQLKEQYDLSYTPEYISSVWRRRIPKIVSEYAKKEWIVWHYTMEEYGKWKKCSRCGSIKLAHNLFFSKNGTSRDGFYSLCKDCRNKKKTGPALIKPRSKVERGGRA